MQHRSARRSVARATDDAIKVVGAAENNLADIDVEVPLGTLTCVTGVSGSGKSTLVSDIIYRALSEWFYRSRKIPGRFDRIEGIEQIDKVVNISQAPIGRTPQIQPRDVHRDVRSHPPALRQGPGGQGEGIQARAFQLQRQGRALRGVPGRRSGQDRDALPAGRLRHLRGVRRDEVQP